MVNAYDQVIMIRDKVLPAAEKAYQGTLIAFREGKLALLDVLDSQSTLIELQEQYLDALQSYHLEATTIESFIGRSLSEL
jgi:cobalt-zinc-cadmium efflux system outer membrane protein